VLRLWAALSAALIAFGIARSASAQGTDEFGAYGGKERSGQKESPQHAAFELRFGPYRPNVDSEFAGATPFEDTFGNDTRWLVGIEVDWQALRIPHFGSIGPGFGWGYTKFGADAPLSDGTGTSAQRTTLAIMPMYVVGVLRVDFLAKDTAIPLVPYGKLGFGYALWWSGDGDGAAHGDDGTLGRGASYGWQFALGLMLLLDFMDRDSAVMIDNTTGVNNSYLFLEWYQSHIGTGDQMRVGTNTYMFGLALEI